jgi:hypothetical protein
MTGCVTGAATSSRGCAYGVGEYAQSGGGAVPVGEQPGSRSRARGASGVSRVAGGAGSGGTATFVSHLAPGGFFESPTAEGVIP